MATQLRAETAGLSRGAGVHCRSHRWLVEEVEPAEHLEGDTVGQRCFDEQVLLICGDALPGLPEEFYLLE
jgi:hypothetical protein